VNVNNVVLNVAAGLVATLIRDISENDLAAAMTLLGSFNDVVVSVLAQELNTDGMPCQ
jgi:hypothetical protein